MSCLEILTYGLIINATLIAVFSYFVLWEISRIRDTLKTEKPNERKE